MNFKPLLSATVTDFNQLVFPLFVSPKLDGIRCIIHGGQAVSRNLKPIRNAFIQDQLKGLPDGLDGELIVGEPNQGLVLNRTVSGVMSAGGTPDFKFHVFDHAGEAGIFKQRQRALDNLESPRITVVPQIHVDTVQLLAEYERVILEDGYEGIMVRDPGGLYKHGRSTLNDRIMGKIKRFLDGEILVTAVEEGVRNENVATRDALGEQTRSMAKSGMVPSGLVGTLIGRDLKSGEERRVSAGRMTHDMRRFYFENPSQAIGKIAHYRVFAYGSVNTPRFATFQCFREDV